MEDFSPFNYVLHSIVLNGRIRLSRLKSILITAFGKYQMGLYINMQQNDAPIKSTIEKITCILTGLCEKCNFGSDIELIIIKHDNLLQFILLGQDTF